jgi:hypothetical protein
MTSSESEVESLLRVISGLDQLLANWAGSADRTHSQLCIAMVHELHEPLRVLTDHVREQNGDVPSVRFALGKLEERLREYPLGTATTRSWEAPVRLRA